MVPTRAQLIAISGSSGADSANIDSIVTALGQFGMTFGLDLPHRVAHYLAQICEESGGFKWDRELASGKEYEGRKDLGNTHPGDGVRYKGRSGIQLTGRANYRSFTDWCRRNNLDAPDFEANPDLVNTDPWEGLAPIYFWTSRNLNDLADENNIEQITKRINGGLNGYAVRVKFFTRAALVFLGFDPNDVEGFQQSVGFTGKDLDGDPGPKTRAALFKALAKQQTVTATQAAPVMSDKPAVVKEVEKPVVPPKVEATSKRWLMWAPGGVGLAGYAASAWSKFANAPLETQLLISGIGIAALVCLLLIGDWIIRRAKSLIAEIKAG